MSKDTSNLTTTPQTPEMIAAESERQDNIDAVDGGQEDALAAEPGDSSATARDLEEPDYGKRTVIPRSPQDEKRAAIAARFAKTAEDRPFDGDFTNPENLYGEFGKAASAEPEPEPSIVGEVLEPETPAAPEPKTYTLKIRGRDVTLTEEEVLARASKVEAADTYLAESRQLLEEAASIKAERAGRDPQHPEGQSSTQQDGLDTDRPDGQTQRPASETKAIIEKIQFGDPEEAARELDQLIDKRADQRADQGHIERLFNNDLAKSQKALKAFTEANPTLEGDKIAAQVIEANMYDLYREELLSLGLDAGKLPKTNNELANWHRMQRIHGFAVSDTTALLNKARDRMAAWRGTPSTPKPAASTAKPAPRVIVNVDRTERRAAIPNQPTRASVPQRDVAAPQPQTGSDVVKEMRRARGQPVA